MSNALVIEARRIIAREEQRNGAMTRLQRINLLIDKGLVSNVPDAITVTADPQD